MNTRAADPIASIVIVNWNGRGFLDTCLTAVLGQEVDREFEVILVDNGSHDDSVRHVRLKYPRVQVIDVGCNLGFSAGCNVGIRAACGKYVVTLDNDTSVRPGWLRALIGAIESEPGIGAVDSKVLFRDTPALVNSAGMLILTDGRVVGRGFRQADGPQYEARAEVFGAASTAALFSRAMLDEVGLLDESYFAYLDDADLAWRMRLAGWKALYEPAAVVLHAYNGTGGRSLERLLYFVNRNRLFNVVKNASAEMVWRVFRHLSFDAGANVRMWLIKLRVYSSLARHAPRLLAERRRIGRRSQTPRLEVESWFTPASEWERIWNGPTLAQCNTSFLPSELMPWLQ